MQQAAIRYLETTSAQRDQNKQARPELAEHIENMDQCDTILLGYPNW